MPLLFNRNIICSTHEVCKEPQKLPTTSMLQQVLNAVTNVVKSVAEFAAEAVVDVVDEVGQQALNLAKIVAAGVLSILSYVLNPNPYTRIHESGQALAS